MQQVSVIQAANAVGSAKTKVVEHFLYKDNAGTNTLGTDLKFIFLATEDQIGLKRQVITQLHLFILQE